MKKKTRFKSSNPGTYYCKYYLGEYTHFKYTFVHKQRKQLTFTPQGQGWRHTEDVEREQRRKFRVEKKLQEMEEEREDKAPTNSHNEEAYHDLVEFAQEHFNNHERSPEGKLN